MSNVMLNVKSNVKGPLKYTFDSPYVLITGHNGAGKSAIVHSIELACCGQVLDAGGRDSKIKAHLEALTSEEGLYALVGGTEQLVYEWDNKETPSLRNAVSEAMNALTGSEAVLCRFILSHGCDENSHQPELSIPGFDSLVSRYGYHTALVRLDGTVRKSLTQHRALLKELDIVKKYVDSFEAFEATRDEALSRIEVAKAFQKEISAAMCVIVAHEADRILLSMTRYIPDIEGRPTLEPKFHLVSNGLRLGLRRGAIPSGAETVILAVALAASLLKPEECVYILPDRSYDDATLFGLMRVLRTIPCFGAIVTTVSFAGDPIGWDCVGL